MMVSVGVSNFLIFISSWSSVFRLVLVNKSKRDRFLIKREIHWDQEIFNNEKWVISDIPCKINYTTPNPHTVSSVQCPIAVINVAVCLKNWYCFCCDKLIQL